MTNAIGRSCSHESGPFEPGPNQSLWYDYPAADWCSQSLHLGNGFLGASFYGGIETERLDLTEKTMWTGGPAADPGRRYGIRPGGRDHIQQIRRAIVAGEVGRADDLVREHFLGDYSKFGSFSSIGSLLLTFDGHKGAACDYRRELDLSRAVGRISYAMGPVVYKRQYFASYPDRVLVLRFTSNAPKMIGFKMRHELTHAERQVTADGADLTIRGRIDENGRAYCVRVRVLHEGGTVQSEGNDILLAGANAATVLYAAATEYRLAPPDYRGGDPDGLTRTSIEQNTCAGHAHLKRRHVQDYRRLYDRVCLKLPGERVLENMPTNLRWQNWRDGDERDLGLKVLLFNLGRYLLISASRPGSPPSNLQGVWNTYARAPWHGNYQSNVNVQQMYWPCGPVDLLDCQEAYIDWVRGLVVPGRAVAKAYYGSGGWVSHTTGNPWGHAAPGSGLLWGIYPVGAAWHCQHLWEHYAFSLDAAYLRARAYPVMKEAAQFWLANLVPFEGYLISAPSVSAEHGVQERDGVYIEPTVAAESRPEDGSVPRYNLPGVYQDIEMIHDLFTNVLEAAEILDVDADWCREVSEARAKLLPLKIGKHGQLQEWFWDVDSPHDHHRHIAHLYAVHPGRMIQPFRSPQLAAAARTSLNLRGDGRFDGWPYTGGNWARAWRIYQWTRLLDGDRADGIFTALVREQSFESLMTFQHVPSANRLQVDGSMTTPGFMAEMLLQSHAGELHLLPALPRAWSSGSVEGLRGRGGFRVDLRWSDGRLNEAVIEARGAQMPEIRVQGERVDPEVDSRIDVRAFREASGG